MKCKHGYYVDPNGYHIFPKTEKEKIDIWKEAERLYNKEFPETKPQEQASKPVNEVKRFHSVLGLD